MFEIVFILIQQFIDYLPIWATICIAMSIVGSIVFNKR